MISGALGSIEGNMDGFGDEIITMEDGSLMTLPRSIRCTVGYVCTRVAIAKKTTACTYSIEPFILRKYYSEKESIQKTKELIWYKYIWSDLGNSYKFINKHHYPEVFRVSIVKALDLRIPDSNNMNLFILQVRNAIFDKIVFSCPAHLIATANKINKGINKINELSGYVPVALYKKINKIY